MYYILAEVQKLLHGSILFCHVAGTTNDLAVFLSKMGFVICAIQRWTVPLYALTVAPIQRTATDEALSGPGCHFHQFCQSDFYHEAVVFVRSETGLCPILAWLFYTVPEFFVTDRLPILGGILITLCVHACNTAGLVTN